MDNNNNNNNELIEDTEDFPAEVGTLGDDAVTVCEQTALSAPADGLPVGGDLVSNAGLPEGEEGSAVTAPVVPAAAVDVGVPLPPMPPLPPPPPPAAFAQQGVEQHHHHHHHHHQYQFPQYYPQHHHHHHHHQGFDNFHHHHHHHHHQGFYGLHQHHHHHHHHQHPNFYDPFQNVNAPLPFPGAGALPAIPEVPSVALPEAVPKSVAKKKKFEAVPGTKWKVLASPAGKLYYHHTVEKQTVWSIPEEVAEVQKASGVVFGAGLVDVAASVPATPEEPADTTPIVAYEDIEGTEWKRVPLSKGHVFYYHPGTKETSLGMPEAVEDAEIAIEPKRKKRFDTTRDKATEEAISAARDVLFDTMLDELKLPRFPPPTWTGVIAQLMPDTRFYVYAKTEDKKRAFEEYLRRRAQATQGNTAEKYARQKASKEAQQQGGLRGLLVEAVFSPSMTYDAFSAKHAADPRLKQLGRHDRKALFDQHIKSLKTGERMRQQEQKQTFVALLTAVPDLDRHYDKAQKQVRKVYNASHTTELGSVDWDANLTHFTEYWEIKDAEEKKRKARRGESGIAKDTDEKDRRKSPQRASRERSPRKQHTNDDKRGDGGRQDTRRKDDRSPHKERPERRSQERRERDDKRRQRDDSPRTRAEPSRERARRAPSSPRRDRERDRRSHRSLERRGSRERRSSPRRQRSESDSRERRVRRRDERSPRRRRRADSSDSGRGDRRKEKCDRSRSRERTRRRDAKRHRHSSEGTPRKRRRRRHSSSSSLSRDRRRRESPPPRRTPSPPRETSKRVDIGAIDPSLREQYLAVLGRQVRDVVAFDEAQAMLVADPQYAALRARLDVSQEAALLEVHAERLRCERIADFAKAAATLWPRLHFKSTYAEASALMGQMKAFKAIPEELRPGLLEEVQDDMKERCVRAFRDTIEVCIGCCCSTTVRIHRSLLKKITIASLQSIERQIPFVNKTAVQMHEILRSSNAYNELDMDLQVLTHLPHLSNYAKTTTHFLVPCSAQELPLILLVIKPTHTMGYILDLTARYNPHLFSNSHTLVP